jgi:hypothetical protein
MEDGMRRRLPTLSLLFLATMPAKAFAQNFPEQLPKDCHILSYHKSAVLIKSFTKNF